MFQSPTAQVIRRGVAGTAVADASRYSSRTCRVRYESYYRDTTAQVTGRGARFNWNTWIRAGGFVPF